MRGLRSPGEIFVALGRHEVEYVVIGGLAAVAHGSRRMTRDVDIVVRPEDANLARLEGALIELGAVALERGGGARPIEPADVATIALGTTLHTSTAAGRLDVVGAPAGAAPFDQLRGRAIEVSVLGQRALVVGLDDLLAMKRASSRPLDLQDIADLTAAPPE